MTQVAVSWRNQRVLVTGGAGFIGSELTAQLIAAGARVTVLDSLLNGRRENLTDLAAARCTLVVGDVRDDTLAAQLLHEHEVVFHLACLGVRHSLHAPLENHEVNASATISWLQRAREARIARFVQVSSSEVYGPAQRVPIDEDHPTAPTTVYGAAKLAGESYALAMHRSWSLPVTVVRPFNAFGPRCHHEGDAGEVIPRFVMRALAGEPLIVFGDGTQTRDFTYVADTARGIALAGLVPGAIGMVWNLAFGREITILALAQRIAERIAERGTAPAGTVSRIEHRAPRPGDVQRLLGDATRARQGLGYAPTVSLEEGLDRLLAWYGMQGIAPRECSRKAPVRNWLPVPDRS